MNQDILYYVGHVESASDERKKNYAILCDRLGKLFEKLDTTSTLLKTKEDIYNLQKTYPWIKIKQVEHNVIRGPQSGLLTNENGFVQNALFPRWPGEIGLLFSLYKGFKKFLESDKKYLLWLEDDTVILDHFENNFPIYINYLPQDFDYISLSVRNDQKHFYVNYKQLFLIDNDVFCKTFQLYWAGAILISKEGAKKFINYFENEFQVYPWDWLIFNLRSDNFYIEKYKSYTLKPDLPELFQLNYEISPNSTIIEKDILKL